LRSRPERSEDAPQAAENSKKRLYLLVTRKVSLKIEKKVAQTQYGRGLQADSFPRKTIPPHKAQCWRGLQRFRGVGSGPENPSKLFHLIEKDLENAQLGIVFMGVRP